MRSPGPLSPDQGLWHKLEDWSNGRDWSKYGLEYTISLSLSLRITSFSTPYSHLGAVLSNQTYLCLCLPKSILERCSWVISHSAVFTLWGCHSTLCLLPRAAVINYHKLSGLDDRNVFSYNSTGQKSEIKALGGPGALPKGEHFLLLSAPCCPKHPLAQGYINPTFAYAFTWQSHQCLLWGHLSLKPTRTVWECSHSWPLNLNECTNGI